MSAFISPTGSSAGVERALQSDRMYFGLRPHAKQRLRPMIPGEFPGMDLLFADCPLVLVTQVAPGVRTREPIRRQDPGSYFVLGADGEVLDEVTA